MTDEELLEVALAEFRKKRMHTNGSWDQQRAAMTAAVQAVRQAQWDEFESIALAFYPDAVFELAEEIFKP